MFHMVFSALRSNNRGMPRTLPWLQQASTSTVNAPVQKKRRRLDAEGYASRDRTLKRMDTFAPPSVQHMSRSDDCYILVEDELHDIAHQFTRSLHRAEYQRSQALAASKNASNISEIQRPTNGPGVIPREHLIKLERIVRAKEQDKMLKNVPQVKNEDRSNSDDEEKERISQWEGTNLGALMLSPGQRKRDLSTKWNIKTTTRAAAGYNRGKTVLATRSGNGDTDVSRRLFGGGKTCDGLSAAGLPGHLKLKKSVTMRKKVKVEHRDISDEDDDLDAPVTKIVPKAPASRHPYRDSASGSTSTKLKGEYSAPSDLSVFDDFVSLPVPKSGILGSGRYKGRAMAALAKRREMENMK